MTDTEMLDWLERQNAEAVYSGRCVFRRSETGRGWRLHETRREGSSPTVREAIREAMMREGAQAAKEKDDDD